MEWGIGLLILESVSDSAFFLPLKWGSGRGSFDFLREKYVGLMKND